MIFGDDLLTTITFLLRKSSKLSLTEVRSGGVSAFLTRIEFYHGTCYVSKFLTIRMHKSCRMDEENPLVDIVKDTLHSRR